LTPSDNYRRYKVKKTTFFIAGLLIVIAGLLGGCASTGDPQGPAQANPTAPDLRQEVDRGGSGVNRPPWEK
jgi:hypothetical protein